MRIELRAERGKSLSEISVYWGFLIPYFVLEPLLIGVYSTVQYEMRDPKFQFPTAKGEQNFSPAMDKLFLSFVSCLAWSLFLPETI